ncbi:MAG: hypothetical protein JRJ37_00890 [Deltaproteobacteria bacterium]|nr:hypothetical protein [Deltaproteobacteria bacterium]
MIILQTSAKTYEYHPLFDDISTGRGTMRETNILRPFLSRLTVVRQIIQSCMDVNDACTETIIVKG